jgi:hypothetical protein
MTGAIQSNLFDWNLGAVARFGWAWFVQSMAGLAGRIDVEDRWHGDVASVYPPLECGLLVRCSMKFTFTKKVTSSAVKERTNE